MRADRSQSCSGIYFLFLGLGWYVPPHHMTWFKLCNLPYNEIREYKRPKNKALRCSHVLYNFGLRHRDCILQANTSSCGQCYDRPINKTLWYSLVLCNWQRCLQQISGVTSFSPRITASLWNCQNLTSWHMHDVHRSRRDIFWSSKHSYRRGSVPTSYIIN